MYLDSPEKRELLTVARPSNLSRCQVIEVQSMISHFYPQIDLKVVYLPSQGDCDKISSLRDKERSNFFTDSLDEALIQGKARLAVHSAKDLPEPLPPQLKIAAITRCIDDRDVIVFRSDLDLTQPLPKGLRIATSSSRREAAVRKLLEDPFFQDLRGTIEERLSLIEKKQVDGVVVAQAALIRLQLDQLPRLYLTAPTTPGQGSLALVVREDDEELLQLFSIFDRRLGRPRCYYLGIDPAGYKTPFALLHCPLIQTQSLLQNSRERLDSLLINYERCSHVLLTSPRAAQYVWSALQSSPFSLSLAPSKTWLCIGSSTASALGEEATRRLISPEGSTAEDMLPHIEKLKGSFVLYPHSEQARTLLKNSLIELEIDHFSLPIYQTIPRPVEAEVISQLQGADELILTSPSCVQSVIQQIQPLPECRFTPIGKVTELALQKYQIPGYTAFY